VHSILKFNHLIPENLKDLTAGAKADPLFLYADGLRANEIRDQGFREAKAHRLVKAPKCPTVENELETAFKKHKFNFHAEKLVHCAFPIPEEKEREPVRMKTPHGTAGTMAIVEYREWAEEWRIRTQAECTSGQLPPSNEGERESINLSMRAAKKIAESCEYMYLQKGGFKTFVTGTFSPEKREAIERGETTIQKEVSRTMEALQKMYQRGWKTKAGDRVQGHDEGLPYLWVVEVPKNENGEDNPHVHFLLGWRVEYAHFAEWAERIERLWGNGYFHLEKIKDSACAGAYMAKAAGYLTKAAGMDNQGVVQGNRYGISESARAPDWVTLTKSQLHTMGQLIFDIYDHLSVKYGEKYRKRKALNKALSDTPKENKPARKRIGEKLAEVRSELKKIPLRCNRYQLIVRGSGNASFLFGWLQMPFDESKENWWPEWLPEMVKGGEWKKGDEVTACDSQYFSRLREKYSIKRLWRRLNPPDWVNELFDNLEFWHGSKYDYESDASWLNNRESEGYAFGYL